jgi:hypothetical protein
MRKQAWETSMWSMEAGSHGLLTYATPEFNWSTREYEEPLVTAGDNTERNQYLSNYVHDQTVMAHFMLRNTWSQFEVVKLH